MRDLKSFTIQAQGYQEPAKCTCKGVDAVVLVVVDVIDASYELPANPLRSHPCETAPTPAKPLPPLTRSPPASVHNNASPCQLVLQIQRAIAQSKDSPTL